MSDQVERIDVRVSPENKRLIERAAAARGHSSISGFAAVELVQAAREALEESDVLTLSVRDWDRFIEILDHNEPNDALTRAAKNYRNKHGI